MPELPDVEEFKHYLDQHCLHRDVLAAEVAPARMLRGAGADEIDRRLNGREFVASRRHGKHLLVQISQNVGWLAIHFGMTGRLHAYGEDDNEPRHTRVRIDFADGGHLAYVDQRMIGRIELADDADGYLRAHDLGPDALDLSWRDFRARVAGRRGAIKPLLMTQSVLAGIGNVYSDEILYHARVHPLTSADHLDENELRAIHREMRRILRQAIAKHADPQRLPQDWILPHRGERHARANGHRLQRIRVGGRTALLSPEIQQRK